jgi:DNA polymerase III delta subunit
VSTLVLISGEEEFLMERAARDEAGSFLADEILEYGGDDLDSFLLESQTSPIVRSRRAFILWGAKDVPYVPDGDDLFVIVSGKKLLKDPRAVRSLKFPLLKSYPENNEVVKWILKEGERFNIDLSRVAVALFVNVGKSLRKLSSEISKLSETVSPGACVTPDDARPLMCFSSELTPKEVVDSVCDGHTARALAFYDKLQERGDETGWIIAYMQRHVVQQLKLETLQDRKSPDDETAAALGVHVFVLRRILMSRGGLWSKDSLKSSLEVLCDADVSHKSGSAAARFVLESEIVRLSEEARNVKRR